MKEMNATIFFLLGSLITISNGFSSPIAQVARGGRQSVSSVVTKSSEEETAEEIIVPTSDVVQRVAVTGATGKTGKLVVDELLSRNVKVLGLVRNETKAAEIFGDYSADLEIKTCNLADSEEIGAALEGCDATIWCATGFADGAMGQMAPTDTVAPEQSIDIVGIPAVAKAMGGAQPSLLKKILNKPLKLLAKKSAEPVYPKVVMLSR